MNKCHCDVRSLWSNTLCPVIQEGLRWVYWWYTSEPVYNSLQRYRPIYTGVMVKCLPVTRKSQAQKPRHAGDSARPAVPARGRIISEDKCSESHQKGPAKTAHALTTSMPPVHLDIFFWSSFSAALSLRPLSMRGRSVIWRSPCSVPPRQRPNYCEMSRHDRKQTAQTTSQCQWVSHI